MKSRIRQLGKRALARWDQVTGPKISVVAGDSHDPGADEPGLVVHLQGLRWLGDSLELTGWAYIEGSPGSAIDDIQVSAVDTASGDRIAFTCERNESQEPNHQANANTVDLTGAAFAASATLPPLLREGSSWRIEVDLASEGMTSRRGFTSRATDNSPAALPAGRMGRWTVRLTWAKAHGLRLHPERARAVADTGAIILGDSRLDIPFEPDQGWRPSRAVLVGEGGPLKGRIRRVHASSGGYSRWVATWDVSRSIGASGPMTATVGRVAGRLEPLSWNENAGDLALTGGPHGSVVASADASGAIVIRRAPAIIRSISARSGGGLHFQLAGNGGDIGLTLLGPRATAQGSSSAVAPGSRGDERGAETSCTIPLAHRTWSGADMPLPEGTYRLHVTGQGGIDMSQVGSTSATLQNLPVEFVDACGRVRCSLLPGGDVIVTVEPNLGERERGPYWKARMRRTLGRQPRSRIDKGLLYLDSWYGKSFSDNPLALYPQVKDHFERIWIGVTDMSVETPPGAERVIIGSRKYWELLGSAGCLIVNTFLPATYVKKPQQYLLQTWHGTPLKLLGLDRPERVGNEKARARFHRISSQWNALISPNPYSTEVFRRAYAFGNEMLETGYPRNDVLTDPAQRSAQVRRWLGIRDDQQVVLYAPTWREDDKKSMGPLDCVSLQAGLGEGYQVLVRGHSVTLRRGSDIRGSGILDVTSYPDMADLLSAADVLVTDYSSCMFDFSATGRPMVFHVPDMAKYMDRGRGCYFDLAEIAPGPVCRTFSETIDAVARSGPGERQDRVQSKYAAWVAKFNPWDDGQASERVVAALLAGRP